MTEDEQIKGAIGKAEAAFEAPHAGAEAAPAADEVAGAQAQPAGHDDAQPAGYEELQREVGESRPSDAEASQSPAAADALPETPPPTVPGALGWRRYKLKGERYRPCDCMVVFARSAYNKIVEHLSRDVSREHGGLLLGHVATSPFSDETAVWVMDALPAKYTEGTRSRLKFTQDTWADFDDVTEHFRRRGMEYKRVGWYHSHPSFGIFLSGYDLDVCADFRLPTHVALVYDPINHEGGFFVRGEAGYDPGSPRGFWEFPNVQPTPGPVDWHNIKASQGDAASPGSESASAADSPQGDAREAVREVLSIGKKNKAEEVTAAPAVTQEPPPEPARVNTPRQVITYGGKGSGKEVKAGRGVGQAIGGVLAGFINLFTRGPKRKDANNGVEAAQPEGTRANAPAPQPPDDPAASIGSMAQPGAVNDAEEPPAPTQTEATHEQLAEVAPAVVTAGEAATNETPREAVAAPHASGAEVHDAE